VTELVERPVGDGRSAWASRIFWMPSGYALVFAGVLVSENWKLGLMVLAAVSIVVAIVRTRGRGAWAGIPLGLLAGLASIVLVWYFDTHTLTTASAIVLSSVVIAAAIIGAALILRHRPT